MLDCSIHSNKNHPYFSKAFVLICDLSTALFNMRELQMRSTHSSFLLAPLLTVNHPSTYSCYLSFTSPLLLWNGLNTRKAAGSAAASQFKGPRFDPELGSRNNIFPPQYLIKPQPAYIILSHSSTDAAQFS